jgi:hypothetical protein
VVDTGESGRITITGEETVTLEGWVGIHSEVVKISTTGDVFVTSLLKVKALVEIECGGLIVGDSGQVVTSETGSKIRIVANGDVFIADNPALAGSGLVSAHESVEIEATNVSIAGTVEVLADSATLVVSSTEDIQVTGLVESANTIECYAGSRDAAGNFLFLTDDQGNILGNILVASAGQLVAQGNGIQSDDTDSIYLSAAGNIEILSALPDEDLRLFPDYYLVPVTRIESKPVGIRHFVDPDNPTITETHTVYYETTYEKEVDWEPLLVGDWYYTVEVDVDQIGWYDPDGGQELPIGDDGQPQLLPSTGETFGVDYPDPDAPGATSRFRRLYQIGYHEGSGLLHTVLYGKDRVLVRDSDELTDLIAAGTIDPSLPSPYLGEGYVYLTKTDYLYLRRLGAEVEQMEYIPAWHYQTDWDYVHCAEFLGSTYEALPPERRPDFYLKIQVGAQEDIKKSIALPAEDLEYYPVGNTWIEAQVNLHQIGWWWPGWKEGLSRIDIANDPDNIKEGWQWDDAWIPEGFPPEGSPSEPLTLAWFADTRDFVSSGTPAYEHNTQFQKGVKKPGAEWVPWYVLEYIDGTGVRRVEIFDGSYLGYYADAPGEEPYHHYDLGENLGIYRDLLASNWKYAGDYTSQAEAEAALPAIGEEILNSDGSISVVEEHRIESYYEELWSAAVKWSFYDETGQYIGSYQENITGLFSSQEEAEAALPSVGAEIPEQVIRRVESQNVVLQHTEQWSAAVVWEYHSGAGEYMGSSQESFGQDFSSAEEAFSALPAIDTEVTCNTRRVTQYRISGEKWSAEALWKYLDTEGLEIASTWIGYGESFASEADATSTLPEVGTQEQYQGLKRVSEHGVELDSTAGTWSAQARWEYYDGEIFIGSAWESYGDTFATEADALAALPAIGGEAAYMAQRSLEEQRVEQKWSAEARWDFYAEDGGYLGSVWQNYGTEFTSEAEAVAALPLIDTEIADNSTKRVTGQLVELVQEQDKWAAEAFVTYLGQDGKELGFGLASYGEFDSEDEALAALPGAGSEEMLNGVRRVDEDGHVLILEFSQEWWKAEALWNDYSEEYAH